MRVLGQTEGEVEELSYVKLCLQFPVPQVLAVMSVAVQGGAQGVPKLGVRCDVSSARGPAWAAFFARKTNQNETFV